MDHICETDASEAGDVFNFVTQLPRRRRRNSPALVSPSKARARLENAWADLIAACKKKERALSTAGARGDGIISEVHRRRICSQQPILPKIGGVELGVVFKAGVVHKAEDALLRGVLALKYRTGVIDFEDPADRLIQLEGVMSRKIPNGPPFGPKLWIRRAPGAHSRVRVTLEPR